jgi:SAM-dependent methyltransferase
MGLTNGHKPASGKELPGAFYDQLYATTAAYHCFYSQSHYYFLWTVIVDRVRHAGIQRVLEIGCGPGQLAAFLLDQGVTSYTGLDFSPKAIELARNNAPRGHFTVGNALLPDIHRQADHDLVICTEVLEHITDDLVVLSHFLPGKRCLCSVPNFPLESHVRHFKEADAVRTRYGAFFDNLDILTLKSPICPTDEFFLMDGVRNAHVCSQVGQAGKPDRPAGVRH